MRPAITQEASSTLRQRLLQGESLHLEGAANEARTLPAEWISEAVQKSVRIDLRHAIIRGALNLKDGSFEDDFCLIDCEVEQSADFSSATFKRRLVLDETQFNGGLILNNATVHYDASFAGTRFIGGEASFVDMQIHGNLSAKLAVFEEGVKADFTGIRVAKSAMFWGTSFGSEVDFDHAHLAGSGDFRGAVFSQRANFNPAKIDGGLLFRALPERNLPAALFAGEADFGAVEVGIGADFNGVRFKNEDKTISFDGTRIEGTAIFTGCSFAGAVRFDRMQVRDSATFESAAFGAAVSCISASFGGDTTFNKAQFTAVKASVNFENAKFGGNGLFQGALFAGDVSWLHAHFCRAAAYNGAVFRRTAEFNSAAIDGLAVFQPDANAGLPAATFEGRANFVAVKFAMDAVFDRVQFVAPEEGAHFERAVIGAGAWFRGTRFAGTVSFNAAKIGGDAYFQAEGGVPAAVFEGAVNLTDLQIGANAVFDGAEFRGSQVSFENATIGGRAAFRRARFDGVANFQNARIGSTAVFHGVVFGKEATFNGTKIGGSAMFQEERTTGLPPAVFHGPLNFTAAEIGLDALFDQVQFTGPDEVSFSRARIGSAASFSKAMFAGGVNFTGARIGSQALFDGTTFCKTVTFEQAEIGANAFFRDARFLAGSTPTFSGARFRQATLFQGAIFEDAVDFRRTHFEQDARFHGARFDKAAYFGLAHFAGSAFFNADEGRPGPTFRETASFNGASIDGFALFRGSTDIPGATFEGDVDFIGTKIGFNADFDNVQLLGADATCSFYGAKVGGNAFFRNAVFAPPINFGAMEVAGDLNIRKSEFRRGVQLVALRVGGMASFTEAVFTGEDQPAVSLARARIEGNVWFDNCVFVGEANFIDMHVGSQASFKGAHFSAADRPVSFDGVHFGSIALFLGSVFEGEAQFRAHFGNQAAFQGAVFKKRVTFNGAKIEHRALFRSEDASGLSGTDFFGEANFGGALFGSSAEFMNAKFHQAADFFSAQFNGDALFYGTEFLGETDFSGAQFRNNARLDTAVFTGKASFEDASFRAVYFADAGQISRQEQFRGKLDMRGCTYDRISGEWLSMSRCFQPYDRQPYTQLEKVMRAIGQPGEADRVYLASRHKESEQLRFLKEKARWTGDFLYKWVLNYGVRPIRLLGYVAILLLLGAGTLSTKAAAVKREKVENAAEYDGFVPSAIKLSVNQFLPIDVPMGSQWRPSDNPVEVKVWVVFDKLSLFHWKMSASTFTTFFLKLAGWILVPLGVAAFGRLLRQGKS